MEGLEEVISERRNTLKTDRLDMSFGELMNIYEDDELFISPEYQRVFRWSKFQQTRFIESVLLGIPIPPIFVAEDEEGKWELVDGLQRISTIFSFFGLLTEVPDKNNFTLTTGELIEELEGATIQNLPIRLKTTIKRAVCRVEIVRWDSTEDIRYELFNRLNTGASPLSDQEIRNCIFRSYPVDLNKILKELAEVEDFITLVAPSNRRKEEMFLEELALRYFAFKHLQEDIKTTVGNYLTEFMREVSNGDIPFQLDSEKQQFEQFVVYLNGNFGSDLFRPKGNFALHLFDSLSSVIPVCYPEIEGNEEEIATKIRALLEDQTYAEIGTASYSLTRMRDRVARAREIFEQ